ncbi:agmatinase family protein [Alteribacter keqinensis]|uniref:Formimidoylglutamase n=1 Tax=Alteribacter keqinensis TaxID=2483800 RepID=A0A3M7TNP9_9BACI|nr:agmatinase family protein [Alteribacter keqinensis]RNA67018.1 formimidoylglutamase [Alteribacter keqinensis]
MNPYEGLERPPFVWNQHKDVPEKVHEWIRPVGEKRPEDAEAVLYGVPLSRSSISPSAASAFPEACRRAWRGFTTYNLDEDVNLSGLRLYDLGDVKQHVTDIPQCHQNIVDASADVKRHHPGSVSLAIGGDHSITAMIVKGLKEAAPDKTIGIVQLDTHFDLRDMRELGPANGTPIRNMVESGLVKGEHIHNIGLHGFFNTPDLKDYADHHGIHYTTLKQARKNGVAETVAQALESLGGKVDCVYFTCDMDVLDMAYAPGVPATTPGGMRTDELFEAALVCGRHPKVMAMDIVCLDPEKDVAGMTVKAGTHVMLSFLTGVAMR